MSILKKFFRWQFNLSHKLDSMWLDESYTTYGPRNFYENIIPDAVEAGGLVYDVGGGKKPRVTPEMKKEHGIILIGLDIDAEELSQAPAGVYDDTKVLDITKTKGPGDGDFVVSRSVLEHLQDTKSGIENMLTYLKPGGVILFYAPCRNAVFARLNSILPEGFKNKLINYFYGDLNLASEMGFKAYYDQCTPKQIDAIIEENNLQIIEKRVYHMSNYFSFLTPVHLIWRLYQKLIRATGSEQFCEGFSYVLRKP